MICEKCWADASLRQASFGGAQVDHYNDLLEERKDMPCSKLEQREGEELEKP